MTTEFNENEGIAFPKLCDSVRAVVKGKFIAPSAFIKKLERSNNSNLKVHLKVLEEKEAKTPNRSKLQKIIKFRSAINKLETKRTKE